MSEEALLNTVISNTAIGDCTKGGTEVSRDFQEYARAHEPFRR